jgi:hypothetical protein
MTDPAAPAPGASPDPQFLAESLRGVAAAFDRARMSGLSVSVPESLYLACQEIVDRHDLPGGKPPGAGRRAVGTAPGPPAASGDQAAGRVGMKDVPLRRLVWQVVNPGEQFTVADIAARVAELGASWPTTAVSNVLGYWASRDRLTRVRKGTYLYPHPGSSPGPRTSEHDQRQEGPAASTSRDPRTRGEEHGNVPISGTRRKAAS